MSFTTLPTLLAGSVLTADHIASIEAAITELRPITAAKASTTSRNTTTSRTADPDLVLALPASTVWDFMFVLYVTADGGAGGGDFSGEIQFPANATVTVGAHALDIAVGGAAVAADLAAGTATLLDTTSPTGDMWIGCSTFATMGLYIGRITLGATAGNLTLAWAQQASNASNTNLLGGSFATARRVS